MANLKRLQAKNNELNFRQGLNFGLGFFTAFALFFTIILPIFSCIGFFILTLFSQALDKL